VVVLDIRVLDCAIHASPHATSLSPRRLQSQSLLLN
jgi:hypothetical protein